MSFQLVHNDLVHGRIQTFFGLKTERCQSCSVEHIGAITAWPIADMNELAAALQYCGNEATDIHDIEGLGTGHIVGSVPRPPLKYQPGRVGGSETARNVRFWRPSLSRGNGFRACTSAMKRGTSFSECWRDAGAQNGDSEPARSCLFNVTFGLRLRADIGVGGGEGNRFVGQGKRAAITSSVLKWMRRRAFAARAASSNMRVPSRFTRSNRAGAAKERGTWLSAARCNISMFG